MVRVMRELQDKRKIIAASFTLCRVRNGRNAYGLWSAYVPIADASYCS